MATSTSALPETMLAAQLLKIHEPPTVHKIPVPAASSLNPYDILVQTAVASFCHTDMMVQEGIFQSPLPITMSHEGSGIVAAVGPKVSNFKVGDRVLSGLQVRPCMTCSNCQPPNGEDWQQYCFATEGALGILSDGAFAEYHITDARTSSHLPAEVPFTTAAPLACAGVTVYRAVITSEVKEGGWLAIVGAGGGLGHLGIQMAQAMGINVIAIDARDEGFDVCRSVGAKHILDAREGETAVVKKVHELTNGQGADAVVNVSDHATAAALSAAITKLHGTVVQAAQPPEVTIPFQHIVLRDVKIKGTVLGGTRVKQEMLDFVAKHNIKAIVKTFDGLEKIPELFEFAKSGQLKGKAVCIVNPNLK